IVSLSLVALLLGLRLYSVLGERSGHEKQPILKPADPGARVGPQVSQPAPPPSAPVDAGDMAFVPTAGPGVRAILAADPTFDVAKFLEGAKAAYRLILESFWKGDIEAIRSHVDDHVLETFAGAVEQRKKDGLTLDNRLVNVEQAVISEASAERGAAVVTVRFEADTATSRGRTAERAGAPAAAENRARSGRWARSACGDHLRSVGATGAAGFPHQLSGAGPSPGPVDAHAGSGLGAALRRGGDDRPG